VSQTIFGVNPVLEALRKKASNVEKLFIFDGALSPRVSGEILNRAGAQKIRIEKVDKAQLERMSDGGVHQGVVAEVRDFEYLDLKGLIAAAKKEPNPLVVVLDGIQDPHNLGAIIRSAHAFGAQGVVIMKDRAASVTGVVAKASAGALAHVPVAKVTNLSRALEELKDAGFWTVAAEMGGEQSLWEAKLTGPLALVVGAEGDGVRKGVLGHCDFKLRIDIEGEVGSLNASVSAAVVLYEIARQRKRSPSKSAASKRIAE
jgi:23S rRNA (guanosine2251-2'-O)-methyltransferase